ncbi:MAG: hypothetical protein V4726_20950 [Verrucomicrobiota bacterium]
MISKPLLHVLLLTVSTAGPIQAALVSTINPLGRALTGVTSTAGGFISASDMQTLVTSAGNTALAGVFDNESPSVATGGNITTVEPRYSAAGLTIGGMTRYGRNDFEATANTTPVTSGTRPAFISVTETWALAAKDPGFAVTEFGAIFNHVGATRLITAIATFTDNTTLTHTSPASTTGTGIYEWVGFQAPAGLGIKSITVTEPSGGGFLPFDDIAYRVSPVPEPATAGLGALVLGGLLRHRRRAGENASR